MLLGIIIGAVLASILWLLHYDYIYYRWYYTHYVLSIIISPPFLLYNLVYAKPHDKYYTKLLEKRGWIQLSKFNDSKIAWNSQYWVHPEHGDMWFGDACKIETGKYISLKSIVFNKK